MYNRNTSISNHRGSYISIRRAVCSLPEVLLAVWAAEQDGDQPCAAATPPPMGVPAPQLSPWQGCITEQQSQGVLALPPGNNLWSLAPRQLRGEIRQLLDHPSSLHYINPRQRSPLLKPSCSAFGKGLGMWCAVRVVPKQQHCWSLVFLWAPVCAWAPGWMGHAREEPRSWSIQAAIGSLPHVSSGRVIDVVALTLKPLCEILKSGYWGWDRQTGKYSIFM